MESEPLQNETTGPCLLPQDISEIQWNFYYVFVWWLECFGAVFIGSFGIFFNLITIFVLLSSELASSFFNWLLVCLAVFDSVLLLNGILEALRNYIGSTDLHTYIFVVFLYPFRSVVMCCSIYTTVMLALERYNALVSPKSHYCPHFRSGRQSLKAYFNFHCRRLLKYLAPIVIFSTIYCIPKKKNHQARKRHGSTNKNFVFHCHFVWFVSYSTHRPESWRICKSWRKKASKRKTMRVVAILGHYCISNIPFNVANQQQCKFLDLLLFQ